MEINYVEYEMTPKQQMGWKALNSFLRKKYPFVKEMIVPIPLDVYGTFLIVDIVFDLEDFYKFYNVTPPMKFKDNPYLYKLLDQSYTYLMSYVDDQYEDKFGYDYNDQLEKYLYMAYRSLPKDMRYLQFEKWRGENDIESSIKADEVTVEFRIRDFVPIFDVTKYYNKEEGDLI